MRLPHSSDDWFYAPAAQINLDAQQAALARQAQLTKPRGALGRLEDLAIQLAGLQGTVTPSVKRVRIVIFAADHGIAADNVSAFPQEVTAQMVANMARGGAAISVLARALGAGIELIVLGSVAPIASDPRIRSEIIAPSTANFTQQAAMTDAQLRTALAVGRAAVARARGGGTQLFIGGEMGIGNTTAAAALACAYLNADPAQLVGPGTGIDSERMAHKRQLVAQALELHHHQFKDPFATLMCLGGFEIAAMTGAYIACAHSRLAILVDGFISTAAALAAQRICPGIENWMFAAHSSAEPGHRAMTDALGLTPLLDLGMRLGEGSGAALAVPILRHACLLQSEMATFAEAGVADGQ